MIGRLGTFDDHRVAVEDACFHHGVTDNLQREMLAPAKHAGRHLELVARVAQRLDRGAGGNLAEKRQADGIRRGSDAAAKISRCRGHRLQDFDGASAVGKAADIATLLKSGDKPVNARLGREAQGVAHFVE